MLRVAAQALWLACIGAGLHWVAPSWCFGNGCASGLVAAVLASLKAYVSAGEGF